MKACDFNIDILDYGNNIYLHCRSKFTNYNLWTTVKCLTMALFVFLFICVSFIVCTDKP